MRKEHLIIGALSLGLISFYTYSFFSPAKVVDNTPIPDKIESVNEIEGNILADDGELYGKPVEDLAVANVEEGSPMEQVINLQKEIEKIEAEKKEIVDGIKKANEKIAEQKKMLRDTDAGIDVAGNSLANNLKWLHFTKNNKDLYRSLFNADSFSDFLINYERTEYLIDLQNKQISAAVENRKDVDAVRNELVNEKHLYISLLSELETKENTLIEKHTALADVIRNNQQVLDEQTDRDAFTLKSYRPKVAYNGKWQGVMIVPVSNYTVTSPWGDRVHPIYGNVRHHAGIDLGVDYGAPVRAAADGVVTLSAWYGGYGKAVMLDHGNSISTLYGHNSQILVKNGQVVKQGEIIALAGSTGNSTGPHCHFEVRNNGEDIDPITFVAGGF